MEAKSLTDQTAKLLGARVQTRSMELVLLPMALQVSELTLMYQAAGHIHPPTHTMRARTVSESMDNLINLAKQIGKESPDKTLQTELLRSCEGAANVGQVLIDATRQFSAKPGQEAAVPMLEAANTVLQATMKILVVWDEAEIRRIIESAQWFLDRLALVEGTQSQRSLVICFKGLSDALLHLLALVNKRLKEMIYQEPRETLATALMSLKEAIPELSGAMQSCIRDKRNTELKTRKDQVVEHIHVAIHQIVTAISGTYLGSERVPLPMSEDEEEREALLSFEEENMAVQMEKAQLQLSSHHRYSLGDDFNHYIDAIISNSMAVAQVSRESMKETITALCHQVHSLHQQLLGIYEQLVQTPDSQKLKVSFDNAADLLCEKLIELDHAVGDSVIDQVAHVVVDSSAPVDRLIEAVSSATVLSTHSSVNLDQEIDDFKQHSRQLTQVAVYAAESAPDQQIMKALRNVATEIENVTPQVITAARKVYRDPDSESAQKRMEDLKHKWAGTVSKLASLIDDVTDPRDYIVAAEVHIHDDIAKCRDSTKSHDPNRLSNAIDSLAVRTKRVARVAKTEAQATTDPSYKKPLHSAAAQLDKDVGQMSSEGSRLLQNMEDKAQEKRFVRSVREVHDGLQDIKNILIAQPNITIKEPASTSTPLTGPSQFTRGEPRTLSGRRIASNFSSGRQNTSATKGTSPSPKHPRGAPVPAMRKNIAPVARTPKAASGQPLLLEEEVTRTDTRPFEAFPRTTPRKLQPGKDEVDSGSSSVEAYAHMPATIARERGVQYEETRRKGAGGGSARPPSYGDFGEGYSRSYTTGEAETQTPLARKRDEEVQTAKEERMAPKVLAETHTVAVRAKEPRKPKVVVTKSTSTSNLYTESHCDTSLQTGAELWEMDSIVDTSSPYSVYTLPIQRLVNAAVMGDPAQQKKATEEVEEHFETLLSVTKPLVATLGNDLDMARSLQESSEAVQQLVPVVLLQSGKVADNPQNLSHLDELKEGGKDLVQKLHFFAEVMDKGALPWSQCAQRVIGSATTQRQMEAEISQLKVLVNQVLDVAKATVEAASALLATQDITAAASTQASMEAVVVGCTGVQSQTEQFIALVKAYQSKGSQQPILLEKVQMCAALWATGVKCFFHKLDAITGSTAAPVEALVVSAEMGDRTLHSEQADYVKTLCSAIKEATRNASEGCGDETLIQLLRTTSSNIEKVVALLIDTSELLADTRNEPESVEYQRAAERAEILQRDWGAKVLLVETHVDAMTARTGIVLDQLIGTALAANSATDREEKEQYMDQFAAQSTLLKENLQALEEGFVRLVRGLPKSLPIRAVSGSVDFLKKLSPAVFRTARNLAEDNSSNVLDHFLRLRRQWASKASYLAANLSKITTVDMTTIIAIFDALVSGTPLSHDESSDKEEEEDEEEAEGEEEEEEEEEKTEGEEEEEEAEGEEEEEEAEGEVEEEEGPVVSFPTEGTMAYLETQPPHVNVEEASEGSLPQVLDDEDEEKSDEAQTIGARLAWNVSAEGEVLADSVDDLHQSQKVSSGSAWEQGGGAPEVIDRDKGSDEDKEEEEEEEEVFEEWKSRVEMKHFRAKKMSAPPLSTTLPPGVERRTITSTDKPRPISVGAFSSWMTAEMNPTSQSIAAAAMSLHQTVDTFEEGDNPILNVAKRMSEKMLQIAQYCRGKGELKTQDDMIEAARSIATDGQTIAKFVEMIAKHSTDPKMVDDLRHCAEVIPTTSKQLSIIANVKAATPSDTSAELMLGRNSANLMKNVAEAIQAAESACVKGLKVPEDSEEYEAVELALRWKRRLYQHRYLETRYATRTTRGLREVGKVKSDPSLTDLMTKDMPFGRSP